MSFKIEEIFDGKKLKYVAHIHHKGIGKSKVISGTEQYIVEQKIKAQLSDWEILWENKNRKEKELQNRLNEKSKIILEKERIAADRQLKIDEANRQTTEAQQELEGINKILLHTLWVNDKVDWERLKDKKGFGKPVPVLVKPKKPPVPPHPDVPETPFIRSIPPEPDENDLKYSPNIRFLDSVFKSRKNEKIESSKKYFQVDHKKWEEERNIILQSNQNTLKKWEENKKEIEKEYNRELERINKSYELQVNKAKEQHDIAMGVWSKENNEFYQEQKRNNELIDKRKSQYSDKLPDAITDYCDMVLSNSKYPDSFPQEFNLDYVPETKILVVDYTLPRPEDIPTLKEVKYVPAKNEFKKAFISTSELNKLYDHTLYQIALRSVHELFEADSADAIDSIVFNGWVTFLDKATGEKVTACILTLHTNKNNFILIDLAQIDPKECFKRLKGVGSSKLYGLTPVAPLLQIDKKDKRFVASQEVIDSIEEGNNIATMEWEDFEHLVRELFEKEFSSINGEVKVTRASRDGGVDAIVFDPDPIRGGKIVIQAKRYTNTVNVSAIRDLYGTVVNEGAIKGILISTADFGPDSYNFAKDKPLSLLNGSNLLYLLDKHGYKAKIDLKEAKQILSAK